MQLPGVEGYTVQQWHSRSFPSYGTMLSSIFGMLDGKYNVQWNSGEHDASVTVEGVLCAVCTYTREGRWYVEIHAPSLAGLLRSNGYRLEEE